MNTGPWDFAAELRGPTSVNAAQTERVVWECANTCHLPPQTSTMKVPSEAQTPQGHPRGAALSQQYDMEVCSQDHSERCLGFFLAYVPQKT